MNPPITLEDVARALQDAAEYDDVEARVDMETVRLPKRTRRGEPARAPADRTFSAGEEAQMWRNFAADLGLPDEPEEQPRTVMTTAEILEAKKWSDMLPELMRERSRPEDWSAEDERQYRQWTRGMGLE